MDWKDMWEEEASQESENFANMPEDTLLDYIDKGYCGGYYSIWYAVVGKKNPQKSVPVLLKALRHLETEKTEYYDDLSAIHCATAICQLLGMKDEKEINNLVYGNRLAHAVVLEQLYEQKFG